jgi:ATP-dependent protease ClpP protease subunit
MSSNRFWRFSNSADSGKAELLIYGEIMPDDTAPEGTNVTPGKFLEELKAIKGKRDLTIRINSVGGSLFTAQAIYTQLKALSSLETFKTVIVDAIAASAASVIAMAGDVILMPTGAQMMIHDPIASVEGMYRKSDAEKLAAQLESLADGIAAIYADKTGRPKEDMRALMAVETWMGAEEAVAEKFADALLKDYQPETALIGDTFISRGVSFDLNQYRNRPWPVGAPSKSPEERRAAALISGGSPAVSWTGQPSIPVQSPLAGLSVEEVRAARLIAGGPGSDR